MHLTITWQGGLKKERKIKDNDYRYRIFFLLQMNTCEEFRCKEKSQMTWEYAQLLFAFFLKNFSSYFPSNMCSLNRKKKNL